MSLLRVKTFSTYFTATFMVIGIENALNQSLKFIIPLSLKTALFLSVDTVLTFCSRTN